MSSLIDASGTAASERRSSHDPACGNRAPHVCFRDKRSHGTIGANTRASRKAGVVEPSVGVALIATSRTAGRAAQTGRAVRIEKVVLSSGDATGPPDGGSYPFDNKHGLSLLVVGAVRRLRSAS